MRKERKTITQALNISSVPDQLNPSSESGKSRAQL